MLYPESRQSGKKGHFALIYSLLLATLLLGGCQNKPDADLVRQRKQQYVHNSHLLNERLRQIVLTDSGNLIGDHQLQVFYSDTTHGRIWTQELLPSHRADTILHELQSAIRRAGFSEQAFHLQQIRADIDSTRNLSIDSILPHHIKRLARLEYLLSKAFIHYTMGQRYGFMKRPEYVFNHIDVRDQDEQGRPLSYREVMHQQVAESDNDFVVKALALCAQDKAVEFLHASEPSDKFYTQLETRLAQVTDQEQRHRLMANMERLRWQTPNRPADSERHVLVNIAAQQLWAVSSDTVIQMRVVCGARKTKTPLMKGMLNWLVVNPEWYIPANIVRNEISARAGDSAYFARHRYFITNSSRDTISPNKVSRQQLAQNLYRVTQRRGQGNSLGRLKFNFSNPFDVYLHDTNMPGAFNYADRALSHGCVRVQRPFDLACFLLRLSPDDTKDEREVDRLRVAIGMKPKSDKEREWLEEHADDSEAQLNRFGNHGISPNVPVYIIYYTVYPNPQTGTLETWSDPYGYDAHVLRGIKPFM